jgi:hypothetical protein
MTYQRDFRQKLRVGVVGLGGHAYRNVLPTLHDQPVEWAALCDGDADLRGRWCWLGRRPSSFPVSSPRCSLKKSPMRSCRCESQGASPQHRIPGGNVQGAAGVPAGLRPASNRASLGVAVASVSVDGSHRSLLRSGAGILLVPVTTQPVEKVHGCLLDHDSRPMYAWFQVKILLKPTHATWCGSLV